MKRTGLVLISIIFFALLAFMPEAAREAGAQSSYYTSQSCSACHGTTSTCNGCHAHGVHTQVGGTDINILATPNKTVYQPGETMQVAFSGGNKFGWFRATIFDSSGKEVVRATTSFPAALTATAPTTPGSYTWKAGWYGNAYDKAGAAFADWTPDPNNTSPQHGWEKVPFSFQVAAPAVADITVTDSVLPATDLSVPFGGVTQGSWAEQTVTVKNDGTGNLILGSVGVANPLAAPFSIATNGCSGLTLIPGASCAIKIKFSPTAVASFTDTFDIPSNDADENPVTVSVSGSGTALPLPEITITDSVPPIGDLQVPFGDVTTGTMSEQTVTVKNDGNANLTIGAIGTPNALAAPFSIQLDNCSGKSLAPLASCTFKVRFAPTASGAASDTFTVPSNDADENPATLTVSGNGISAPLADITVTDSVAPTNDLSVPFGDVTQGSWAEQTVTVKNDGNANLMLGNIGQANPLAAPFSIVANGCSGQTLAPAASCTVKIRFSPTVVGGLNDSSDIPSNDPDENPVTVNVSGTGIALPVADITVTDSAAPAGDLAIPFGIVAEGGSAEQTVTVKNDGNANLVIGSVGAANPLAAPFSIASENCAGKTLIPTATCTITVGFAPTAGGAMNDSFDISSSDPDENPVTVSVSGTGSSYSSVPDIRVEDPVLPKDDLSVPFGNVSAGRISMRKLAVINEGNGVLSVGTIAPPAAPFRVKKEDCSGRALAVDERCHIEVEFVPTNEGSFNSTLGIPSNDPDESLVTVSFGGNGLPPGNNPPPKPRPKFPAQGQAGLKGSVEFTWEIGEDPDGDEVEYELVISKDPEFDDSDEDEADASAGNGRLYAGIGSSIGLLFVGLAFIGKMKRRKKIALFVLAVLVTGILLVSCGGGGGGGTSPVTEMSQTVSGLDSDAAYYWKVVADDGQGNIVQSEAVSFTTD